MFETAEPLNRHARGARPVRQVIEAKRLLLFSRRVMATWHAIQFALVIVFLAMVASAPAAAGPLEDGISAYQKGDFATALLVWRPLADQGDAAAQTYLGMLFGRGRGVPQDHTEAARWYRKAADQGNAEAQYNLGYLFANGEGVKQDHAEAARWYRKAAEQDLAEAQYNLGMMYANGEGVQQYLAISALWFGKAADQGDAQAQHNLGVFYATGQGVKQDHAEAAKWYGKAADQGDARAQFNLGVFYANGQGVKQDNIQAHKWFNLAGPRFGDAERNERELALKNRDAVAAKLTAAQIAEAEKLAREWKVVAP